MLAWASAQIHCQFHASESRVALPAQGTKQDVQAESDTVLIPSRGEWLDIINNPHTHVE
jgi:hypothetical protein